MRPTPTHRDELPKPSPHPLSLRLNHVNPRLCLSLFSLRLSRVNPRACLSLPPCPPQHNYASTKGHRKSRSVLRQQRQQQPSPRPPRKLPSMDTQQQTPISHVFQQYKDRLLLLALLLQPLVLRLGFSGTMKGGFTTFTRLTSVGFSVPWARTRGDLSILTP